MSVRSKEKQDQKFFTDLLADPKGKGTGLMRKHRATRKWTKPATPQMDACTVVFPSTVLMETTWRNVRNWPFLNFFKFTTVSVILIDIAMQTCKQNMEASIFLYYKYKYDPLNFKKGVWLLRLLCVVWTHWFRNQSLCINKYFKLDGGSTCL